MVLTSGATFNGRLAEHWDVLQDEATKAESKSGLPMFGDRFTA
jgi:predicted SnoaL-like aldol condensation-catalyzing enzyme